MRTFVAIDLPLPVQMALGSVGAQLRAALPGQRLRWVAPDHIHLTIKFLGEISSLQAEALAADLLAVAAALAPIELALAAAGCFSQRGAPSALWVGLRGEITPLNRLQRAVESAALARGHRARNACLPAAPDAGALCAGPARSCRSARGCGIAKCCRVAVCGMDCA